MSNIRLFTDIHALIKKIKIYSVSENLKSQSLRKQQYKLPPLNQVEIKK